MSETKKSPDLAFSENLAVLSAGIELGAGALHRVMGSDAASTQIAGETQNTKDIQELLAARMAKAFGG
jgi:hypothetical protein